MSSCSTDYTESDCLWGAACQTGDLFRQPCHYTRMHEDSVKLRPQILFSPFQHWNCTEPLWVHTVEKTLMCKSVRTDLWSIPLDSQSVCTVCNLVLHRAQIWCCPWSSDLFCKVQPPSMAVIYHRKWFKWKFCIIVWINLRLNKPP